MKPVQIALSALAAILVVVLFWLLLWSPQQDELETVRDDIDAARDRQEVLAAERDQLRAVRDEAPEVEAELAAASALVPSDPALPSALRQLQQAADEAGALLRAVSPGRPSQVEDADEGVSEIGVSVELEGSYFQIVDFLRRVEDPTITPRGLAWTELTVSRDEYPTLTGSLSGVMYTRLPVVPGAEPEDEPEDDPDAADDDDDDADVTVEVEEDDA